MNRLVELLGLEVLRFSGGVVRLETALVAGHQKYSLANEVDLSAARIVSERSRLAATLATHSDVPMAWLNYEVVRHA